MSEQLPNGESVLYTPDIKIVDENVENTNEPESSEETKSYSDQYVAEHPNAIEDPEKARKMAEASTKYEKSLIYQKDMARSAADHFGEKEFVHKDVPAYTTPEEAAKNAMIYMRQAREDADNASDKAGADYDHRTEVLNQVNNFK